MNRDSLRAALSTHRLGRALHCVDEIDSTNRWALDEARAGRGLDGALYCAARQTAGRGTSGRRWVSDHADGLWFSLVLVGTPRAQPLSFVPGIALVDALTQVAGLASHLKWPNDVLIGKRKVAGILIESTTMPGREPVFVVGVGVNVNQTGFPEELREIAISIRQATGRTCDAPGLLGAILARMEQLLDDEVDVRPLWLARSRLLGRALRATTASGTETIVVRGVSPEGYLEVERPDGGRDFLVSRTGLELEPEDGGDTP